MATLKLKSGETKKFTAHNGGEASVKLNSNGEYVVTYKTKGYKSGVNNSLNYKSVNKRKTLIEANNALIDFGVKSLNRK